MEPEPTSPSLVPAKQDPAPAAPQLAAARTTQGVIVQDHFYSRMFAVGATALFGVLLYVILAPFVNPLLWALFIAFLLHPAHVYLTRRFRGRENLSSALLTLTTLIMLIGPLAALSAAFVSQAVDLVQWVQGNYGKQKQPLTSLPFVGPAIDWIRQTFGLRLGQIQTWITQGMQSLPPLLAGLGGKIFLGAVNTVFEFVIMLFMLFFFVRDGAQLVAALRDLIPMTPERRQELMEHAANVTRAVVFGTGLTALAQGALVSIAFLITGLASPLVFGVLSALLALLPFGGTALVWVPAVVILIVQEHWGMAIVMLVFGTISSTADNLLRPLLISGRVEVGTLTIFIGVLGGAAAFGPIGLFLGPVVLALIIALVRFALEMRRAHS